MGDTGPSPRATLEASPLYFWTATLSRALATALSKYILSWKRPSLTLMHTFSLRLFQIINHVKFIPVSLHTLSDSFYKYCSCLSKVDVLPHFTAQIGLRFARLMPCVLIRPDLAGCAVTAGALDAHISLLSAGQPKVSWLYVGNNNHPLLFKRRHSLSVAFDDLFWNQVRSNILALRDLLRLRVSTSKMFKFYLHFTCSISR